MIRTCMALVALHLVMGGCRSGTPAAAPGVVQPGSVDTTAAVAAIKAESVRFSEAYMREDIDTLVSLYTEDGVAAPGGRDFIRGRDALNQYWAVPPGRDVEHHSATPVEIKVDGDHAYDWGYYQGRVTQNGNTSEFKGTYVIVWRRGADGRWRIAMDMWHGLPKPRPATGGASTQ